MKKTTKTTRQELKRRDWELLEEFRKLVERCREIDDMFVFLRNDSVELWQTGWRPKAPQSQQPQVSRLMRICVAEYVFGEYGLDRVSQIIDTAMENRKREVVGQYSQLRELIEELGWSLDLTGTDYAALRFGPAPNQVSHLKWDADAVDALMESISEAYAEA